jgi:hypothetical protein
MRSQTLSCLVLASLCALAAPACTVTTATAPAPVRPAEARASRNGFELLGQRAVNGSADRDVIPVGRRDGRFRELMLVVERAPVEIYDMVVTFGNGDRWEPRTRLVFGRDTTSRSIDLPGGARVVQRVDFRYGNLVAGTQAKVELWGR